MQLNKMKSFFCLLPLLLLMACQDYSPYPRPLGFPRIDLPAQADRTYQTFDNETCPFSFSYPSSGKVSRDQADSCWADIRFPDYGLTWHLTSRQAGDDGKDRNGHYEEYRRLIYKHAKMATQIRETPFSNPSGEGVLFEIYGDVGTPAQVFFYDPSEQNLLMMSLYFRTASKNDSLQPIINYMKAEVMQSMESMKWK